MTSSTKTFVKHCIWAPMPSRSYIKRLRENMNKYVKEKKDKKRTVATWIVNEDVTHILINLNLETYCLPDIYGKGGKWGLPKGKVEDYDIDLKSAAIREVFEETGYILEYNYVSGFPIKSGSAKKNYLAIVRNDCMKNLTSDFIEYGKEILAVAWAPIRDIGTVIPIDNCNGSLKPLAKYNQSFHTKIKETIKSYKLEARSIK